jgi:hypothetical protein
MSESQPLPNGNTPEVAAGLWGTGWRDLLWRRPPGRVRRHGRWNRRQLPHPASMTGIVSAGCN